MRDDVNIHDLNDEHAELLGHYVAQQIVRCANAYKFRGMKDSVLRIPLFEFDEVQSKQWMQVNIELLTDPLLFYDTEIIEKAYIPMRLRKELIELHDSCMDNLIKLCREHKVNSEFTLSLIELIGNSLTSTAEIICDKKNNL